MELYTVNAGKLDPIVPELLTRLPPERREKAGALRNRRDRLLSLAAGALLLWRFGGAEMCADGDGKPRLVSGGAHFNLSHSGGYAALAVGDSPVGVDVEEHCRDGLRGTALAAFHPAEREEWERGGADAGGFHDLWTLKESYCKMTGRGLSLAPASFRVRREGGEYGVDGDGAAAFRLYRDVPGYSLALCSRERDFPGAATELAPETLLARA